MNERPASVERLPDAYPFDKWMSLTVWSTGETYSRCGPLDPENEMLLGSPPFFAMRVYSSLVSRFSFGVRASDALTGSHWFRIAPMYGAFRHAFESGRTAGSVLNPGLL